MSDLPHILGSGSLTGRPSVRPVNDDLVDPIGFEEDGTPIFAEPPASGKSIPSKCLMVVSVPARADSRDRCNGDCPGRQRDGSCLAEIVRAANAQGVDWSFEIDHDGFWVYSGPPYT